MEWILPMPFCVEGRTCNMRLAKQLFPFFCLKEDKEMEAASVVTPVRRIRMHA
jgi:hypothetical protein